MSNMTIKYEGPDSLLLTTKEGFRLEIGNGIEINLKMPENVQFQVREISGPKDFKKRDHLKVIK